jgi:hypothetical protein
MATLGTVIVLILFLAFVVVLIGLNELLWTMPMPLLKVETASVTQRLEGGGLSTPERSRCRIAVRTFLAACGAIDTSPPGRRRRSTIGREFSGGDRRGRRRRGDR